VQRVLIFADPLAVLDDLLEQADQLTAGLGPALEEADALADAIPRLGDHLLAERDDPVVLHIDLHFLARVGKALVDQERLRGRRLDEPSQEFTREHDVGVHDEGRLARDDVARAIERERRALLIGRVVDALDRHSRWSRRRQRAHLIGAVSDDDHDVSHPDRVERVEHARQDRAAADRKERLLRVIGQGRQPPGDAGGQDDGRHLTLWFVHTFSVPIVSCA